MSRIGKQIIAIPEKTQVTAEGAFITVKGPLGELKKEFSSDITIKIEGGNVTLTPIRNSLPLQALWGTYASHINNMINGVSKAFEKKLIVEGIGFKSEVKGKELTLSLGFSHQIKVPIPEDIKVTAEKNVITITGMSNESVGQFAAKVRMLKKPEPYKGKGIRYEGEVIRRKQGKKSV
ncbi:MAG: 50S ribosomal protein L6 [Candidatus Taylorbacteria bacterium]|nr:50S ribosomal protein L6 [Candidatus Taylorbacteria bacterium]